MGFRRVVSEIVSKQKGVTWRDSQNGKSYTLTEQEIVAVYLDHVIDYMDDYDSIKDMFEYRSIDKDGIVLIPHTEIHEITKIINRSGDVKQATLRMRQIFNRMKHWL